MVNDIRQYSLKGLGVIPKPSTCEVGYYEPIHSGQTIFEKGEQIDGAIRIFRSDIKSFDKVGSVGNAQGSQVFEMISGRKFRLIDRFNAVNYVIGYEVVPCKPQCAPCPSNCKKVVETSMLYARPQRMSASDIEIKVGRKVVKCSETMTMPRVACIT